MQSLEASVSLLVFASLAFAFLSQLAPARTDDSLYRAQLADDVWRVLYLRNHFTDFSGSKRSGLESDLMLIGTEMSSCIFISGIEYTNCRDDSDDPHEIIVSVGKTLIMDGSPESVTLSIGK
jgi:hypothetical protein